MAPRFKKNMYRTYREDKGADAIICFTDEVPYKSVFLFRDKLADKVSEVHDLFIIKFEGEPTPVDSWFRLFEKQDERIVKSFFNRKGPGGFAPIFKTEKWRKYKREEEKINQLARFELITSHDHPCIEVYSSIHSEDGLSELIESVATDLNIDMPKNLNLGSMAEIIMSNRSFDL